jgi:hypothetical protein
MCVQYVSVGREHRFIGSRIFFLNCNFSRIFSIYPLSWRVHYRECIHSCDGWDGGTWRPGLRANEPKKTDARSAAKNPRVKGMAPPLREVQ